MEMPSDYKPKSFWERPEGSLGMVVLAVGAVVLYLLAPTLIAFFGMLITMLGQMIAIVALCTVLAGILFLATNTQFQTLISYLFKSAMRKATGLFVEIDPIGIMKNYIRDLRGRQREMAEARDKLSGQIQVCEKKIKENERNYDKAMNIAAEAVKQGKQSAMQVNSRQAMRLEKLNNETLVPMLNTMRLHLRGINKYHEATDTFILDLQNEVEAKSQERDMILSSYSAMSAAKRILNGDTDRKELFDQAMEFVVEDYGMKMGEINSFLEDSKPFIEGLDLQNGVYEAEALKRVQSWESKADSLLLGDQKRKMLEEAVVPAISIVDSKAPVSSSYGKFLK